MSCCRNSAPKDAFANGDNHGEDYEERDDQETSMLELEAGGGEGLRESWHITHQPEWIQDGDEAQV